MEFNICKQCKCADETVAYRKGFANYYCWDCFKKILKVLNNK